MSTPILQPSTPLFSKEKPFFARLKSRTNLCCTGSSKATHHLVIDLRGSGITYEPGDCIACIPENNPSLVRDILAKLHYSGKELVTDREGNQLSIKDFLEKKANLRAIPKKLLLTIKESLPKENTSFLEQLLSDRTACKNYVKDRDLLDLLQEFPKPDLDPTNFAALLQPMLPRFYSIASSQFSVGEEVHLTIAPVFYQTEKRLYHGTATHWLLERLQEGTGKIPLFIQKAKDFHLPKDHQSPIIMIGPGTGIAPFRAFMQERMAKDAKGSNWLFFGERSSKEFFYKDFWENLVEQKRLNLDVAFSREQTQKVYVQHKMLAQAAKLFSWIQAGAHIYVCGDATYMTKDVEAALCQILCSEGNLSPENAKNYLKNLKKEHRYQKDVY